MSTTVESSADFQGVDGVLGYCPKCRECRSDEDKNAWGFDWIDDSPICRRCGAVVDIWSSDENEEVRG
jgi:hypothetical protein